MSRSLAAALGLIAAGICLAALSPPRGRCGETHFVVRGDTLSHIARRCRSSVMAIARASGVANPNRIEVGQRLTIPNGERMAAAPRNDQRRHAAAHQPGYRFARNDTLYSLARWARVSVPALLAANPGIDPRKIEIGDLVRLPAGAALPYAARLRERGPGPAPARYESPVREEPRRDEQRREERREEADEPDPDKEPEPEGM